MVAACIGGYMLTPKWQAVRSEQQRLADPLRDFTNPQTPEAQLSRLQEKIRANPQDSEQWARLGEYYLYRNAYDNALLAYRQALRLRGDNAQLFAALATVLYYQSGQHMTPATREMINKALALDATEVTRADAAGGGCVYAGGLCASRVAVADLTGCKLAASEPRATGRGH